MPVTPTDDFATVASDQMYLENLIDPISRFLNEHLKLGLHPKKICIRRLHQGVDFLGYLIFDKYRLVRRKTRRRIFAKFKEKIAAYRCGDLSENALTASLQSYLGVFSHADTIQLKEELKNLLWFLD